MIRFEEKWLRESDLAAEIPGRVDPPHIIADCIKYLKRRALPRSHGRGAEVEAMTRQALLRARVRTASVTPFVQALEERIVQQEATITRLLAFVPAKAGTVPNDRQTEILRWLVKNAGELFTDYEVRAAISEESDPESEASHRIEMTILPHKQLTVEAAVAAEVELRRRFIGFVSREELRSVRLLLEFEEPAPDGSV